MPDAKKFGLQSARGVFDPDNALDVLYLTWKLDDGTIEVEEHLGYFGSTDLDAPIWTLAETLHETVVAHHTGGPIMAVGSQDMNNALVT